MRSRLMEFFNVPVSSKQSISGLWLADNKSVAKVIEKQYLSSYIAKPDEMQAQEIRDRLKSLTIYFRIQDTDVKMLTIVNGSMGLSAGKLTQRKGGTTDGQVYDAVMKGKTQKLNAAFVYHRDKNSDFIEYKESGNEILAQRETRSIAELVDLYQQRSKSMDGLAEY